MQSIENVLPKNRRTIGPIPPRDERGRLKIAPLLERRAKRNILGEPIRGEDDQPIEELVDTRPERHYLYFDGSQEPADGATRGLRLFAVDYANEPILKVWARNEHDAVEVYKQEWNIRLCGSENSPPRAIPIQG